MIMNNKNDNSNDHDDKNNHYHKNDDNDYDNDNNNNNYNNDDKTRIDDYTYKLMIINHDFCYHHNHHWSSWRSRNGDDDHRRRYHYHHHHHHAVDGCSSHSVVRTLMDGDEAFFILSKLYELNTDRFIWMIQHLKCYSLLVIVVTKFISHTSIQLRLQLSNPNDHE